MSKSIYRSYFKDSKYIDCYFRINDRPYRLNESYTEKHHILPTAESCWPKFKLVNARIVALSAREHLICHVLLFKHFRSTGESGQQKGMSHAVWRMIHGNKSLQKLVPRASRLYQFAKEARHESMIGEKHKKTTCPHCKLTGGSRATPRHHFENCLKAPNPKPRQAQNR